MAPTSIPARARRAGHRAEERTVALTGAYASGRAWRYLSLAPTVVAWRGLMLTDLGRSEEAWKEFERSMSLGPNKTAATVMVTVLSHAGKPEEVGRICGLTEPRIPDTDDRYAFIELCKEKMNALSDEHIFKVIKEGGASVGKSPLMAPWGGTLNDAQIHDVVAFVRTLAVPPYQPKS